ncbi:MAG: GAF domain-containing protein [Anaerolineae bacterium]|jgi:signal transduction histidine kinase/putative methionine-R-sulfoxide reductase with GAF domain
MTTRYFWILVAMMVAITLIHYLTPQIRPLLPNVDVFLSRHAVERTLFVLPVAAATFAFGKTGGVITLVTAVLVMLPRVIWLSDRPVDATAETVAAAVVGYLVLWMVETQEREKSLRQEAVARMRALNAMSAIAAKSLELEQVLNEALDKALQVTDLDVGLIYFLDRQSDELVLCAQRGMPEKSAQELGHLPLGEGLCGQVARSGEPVVVEDTSRDPQRAMPAVQEERLKSQIIVPLMSKGEVKGVMALGSRERREFPSADVQLITSFGKQIGVGVENAQLHQDVERQLHIQRRLNEVAEQITSELELSRILPKVLQIAEELIGADCGFIALFDPATKCLSYPYLHNLPQDLTDVTVRKGEGVAGEAMAAFRPITIPDYQSYPNAVPAFLEAGLVSVVAVPIASGKWAFGTLAVGSLHEARPFSAAEVSTLSSVGRQAGIAIDNARLYQNMRYYARQITRAQEDERKRIAREAHDETAQVLVALSRRLDALIASPELPSPSFRERLERLRGLTTEALQSVRRFSQDLRPPVLDDLGFVAAVRSLTRNLEEVGVETELQVSGSPYRFSPEEELVLFRIAQEALNNARRHAHARQAKVMISFHGNDVRMVIEDDGRGFDAPDRFVDLVASGRLGLIGMHERARILGGTLQIDSQPGEGTRVIVDAPVHRRG